MPWPRKFRARYNHHRSRLKANPSPIAPQAGSKDAPYELSSESDDPETSAIRATLDTPVSRARIAITPGSQDAPYQLSDDEPAHNDTPNNGTPNNEVPRMQARILEDDVLADLERRRVDERSCTDEDLENWEQFREAAQRFPPRDPGSGGFHNVMATTCYVNSVLQLLSVVQPVRDIILDHHCDRGDHCMACALRVVFSTMAPDVTTSAYPVILAFHLHYPRWEFGQQQDAPAFFDKLIPALALSLVSGSILESVQMLTVETMTCEECHYSRNNLPQPQTYWDMGIKADSVQQCIDAELDPHVVQGTEAVECQPCGRNMPTKKSFQVLAMGDVAVIYLNQLHGDQARANINVKIPNVIQVPTTSGIVSI